MKWEAIFKFFQPNKCTMLTAGTHDAMNSVEFLKHEIILDINLLCIYTLLKCLSGDNLLDILADFDEQDALLHSS